MVFLDIRNGLIRDEIMWEGTIDQCTVHVREVVRRAIELNAAALILVHNHPSGDPEPSRADVDLTRAIAEGGKRLGIAVHDHIVISAQGYTSLRAAGLI